MFYTHFLNLDLWIAKWMVTDMLPIAGGTFSEESLVGCKEAREVFVEMFPSLLFINYQMVQLCINTSVDAYCSYR
jgi:hypothetical protein